MVLDVLAERTGSRFSNHKKARVRVAEGRLGIATKDYARLRVGIGRPPGRQDPSDFVLSDFPGRDRADLGVTLEQAADAVEQVVTLGFDAAQQRLHAPR